jgi:hypothetical protein
MARIQEIVQRATRAAANFRKLDQKQTDAIVRAAYLAALNHRTNG